MPLDTYENLQTAVLAALARPDDPLVAPAVPDMIRLFESEARRRLKGGGNEQATFISTVAGASTIDLPADCGSVRAADIMSSTLGDIAPLQFLAPQSSSPLSNTSGRPQFFTLFGSSARPGHAVMRLVPVPDAVYTVGLNYLRDLPPLGNLNPSNWLLESSPDAYFFGVLVEAEMYVGHDERVTMWLQRRDLAFASIEKADIKARWAGPMQIRVDGITTGAPRGGGDSVSVGGGGAVPGHTGIFIGDTPPASPVEGDAWWDSVGGQLYVWYADGTSSQWVAASSATVAEGPGAVTPVLIVAPTSGDTITLSASDRALFVTSGVLAALTIRLPPPPIATGDTVELGFAANVTSLTVQDSSGGVIAGAPTNAFGPGAALLMRWMGGAWVYWK